MLILSASAGAGHVRAAEAIEKAVRLTGAAAEVRHVDILQFTNKVFRHLWSDGYILLVNKAPEVLGWLYDTLDKPWRFERSRLALDKLYTGPFVKMLREYEPDVIVCTHLLPAEIVSWLRDKGRFHAPQAIVVTDFDMHATWLCHHYEQYFVALDETRAHLARIGIPGDKITVSGIPVDPVFAEQKDKAAMRAKHGLRPDLTTILVSAGGFGVGSIEHMVATLAELRHPAQAIVIAGRNQELKERLDEFARAHERSSGGAVSFTIVGYTTEMDELMTAADLLLGKPGGLTTSEALAKGLILVIVNPIPGQEERNSDHLLEQGVAVRCNNLPTLAYKIDRLLDRPEEMRVMREKARRLARPHAAFAVTEKLLALKGASA